MWHSVSHTSRMINSPKGIRLGEEEKKGDFSASVVVEERERKMKEF